MDEKIGITDQLEQNLPHVGPDYVKNLEGETKEVQNVSFGHVREPLLSSSSGASLRCPATIQHSAMEQAVDPLVSRHSYRILLELRQRVSGCGQPPRSSLDGMCRYDGSLMTSILAMPHFQDTFKTDTTGPKVSVIFSMYTV